MSARSRVTAIHRWVGLVIALQLVASAAGGLFWATRDHKQTRGLDRKKAPEPVLLDVATLLVPAAAVKAAGGDGAAERVRLARRAGRAAWEVKLAGEPPVWVDAATGEVLGDLGAEEAKAIVAAEYSGDVTVAGATLITGDPPEEIFGRTLPLWRVAIADERNTRVYVDPRTGETGSNWFTDGEDWWAWFFAVHTMDWDGGPLEANPLLAAFAIGTLLSALSGLAIWVFRVWPKRRAA